VGASGILSVVKHKGPTSHDIVEDIRRLFDERRVGHGGTLDPAASGVLILGIGKATRILRYFHLLDKTYVATIVFGVATSTLDAQGDVVETRDADFTPDELKKTLSGLEGEIYQIPPMVSALKKGGEPLYKKARRGESVEREPRRQFIYEISLLSGPDSDADGHRRVEIRVRCDSGTYIRTLATQIAESLGTVAHLADLERIAVGPFDVGNSMTLDRLGSMTIGERRSALLWSPKALPHLPSATLADSSVVDVSHGKPCRLSSEIENQITSSLRSVLSDNPYLEESLVHNGLLSLAEAFGQTNDDRNTREIPEGIDLGDGRRYSGPIALSGEDGALIAIGRPAGDILTFDCVLV
jgi:tRNA pseudouridine55 synthase